MVCVFPVLVQHVNWVSFELLERCHPAVFSPLASDTSADIVRMSPSDVELWFGFAFFQ